MLQSFLSTEKHVSVEDLYDISKERYAKVGYATVFRTVKLLKEGGIAQEVYLGDKRIRYEHKYGHQKHIHLICDKCSKIIDVVNEDIDDLENKISNENKFTSKSYRIDIFGTCDACKEK